MKNFIKVSLCILGVYWISIYTYSRYTFAQIVYFDDTDPNTMILGNNYYEIGLRKSNGSIIYITDKSTNQHVTEGSRNECLWGAYGMGGYIGGCSYNAVWANLFTYSWSATTNTLTLNYSPDPTTSQKVTGQTIITVSESPWFDMRLQVQSNWGSVLDYVLFPSDLVFLETDIEQVLLPYLPGIILKPQFFEQNRSYTAKYPGSWFADYMALSSNTGELAIYSLYGQDLIRPLILGFNHDDEYLPDSTYYYHTFAAKLNDGDTWLSPWIRVSISQLPLETITNYRTDNRIDNFHTIQDKLGQLYSKVVQSPLFKADANQLAIPFSQYPTLLSQVPSPGILHPVGFQPRGFDENYPDFIPPAANWGTIAEMAAMFEQAQNLNFLVMPYTNPTWWDDESPTLQSLTPPLTITDVAVLDEASIALYETYGTHGGYVMSPYSPFVKNRLNQLNNSMTGEVPSDMVFEDQIGARPWVFDFNSSSPSPTAYSQGWLEHTYIYSDTVLMTENGFDRLAETVTGFHGGVFLAERLGDTEVWWGIDTWRPYPLATILVRDKVLFYQHDLAPETFTTNKTTLLWNMVFGYMLSYDLVESSYGGGVNNSWIDVVSSFQRYVLSHYANEKLMNFTDLQENVTQTTFESFTVIGNWDEENSYNTGQYVLPPEGVFLTKNDGTLKAGVFTHYNNVPLSNGEHYLIEERGEKTITIRQPMGTATNLTIELLSSWNMTDMIEVWAYSDNNEVIGKVSASIVDGKVTFIYQREIEGQAVSHYTILEAHQIFLPVILK